MWQYSLYSGCKLDVAINIQQHTVECLHVSSLGCSSDSDKDASLICVKSLVWVDHLSVVSVQCFGLLAIDESLSETVLFCKMFSTDQIFFFFFFFCVPSYISGVHQFWWDFCVCDFLFSFESYHRGTPHYVFIDVFIADIHPSRTWMSGSFESVWWNACVHRLVLSLYSHPKEVLGTWVRTHVNSKEKNLVCWRLRGGWNPWHYITQDSEPNTLTA